MDRDTWWVSEEPYVVVVPASSPTAADRMFQIWLEERGLSLDELGDDVLIDLIRGSDGSLKRYRVRGRHLARTESFRECTDLMRCSGDVFWRRLRVLLEENGFDPAGAMVDCWPENGDLEEGWIVTSDGRVFSFDFRYGRKGDLTKMAAEGIMERWEEVTERTNDWYTREDVEAAIRYVMALG
jgi:hypothetical protein